MDIDTLMRQLDAAAGPRPKMSNADAAAALRSALDNWMRQEAFEPGDIIQEKGGLATGSRIGSRGGEPGIFIEYRDGLADLFEKPPHSAQYYSAAPDCLVGWIEDDGGMVISAACSRVYEKA